MEAWEAILETYPLAPDLRSYTKAIKTAEVALRTDLATFESEWITSTLFYKPVQLFETVSAKSSEVSWYKPICDSFKLIGQVVGKYPAEHLYEDIVTLCHLPYVPQVRQDAIQCLSRVAVFCSEAVRDLPHLIEELEDAVTCKAPLAALVGTISEHHPELVADHLHKIWRIYLNLLESSKNTDTVTASVLQGILSLFKTFGADLPVLEFRDLYARISQDYLRRAKCEKVCVSILENHSDLFKELLAKDVGLRNYLWEKVHVPALKSVYVSLGTAVTKDKLQSITDSELVPRADAYHSETRFAALRIIRTLVDRYGVQALTEGRSQVHVVEHELKMGSVSFEAADAILWCIESACVYSDRLLQAAILFHDNIPSSRRRDIVVYGLLNAPDDVRITATTLLITECCQGDEASGYNITQYLSLWRDLFDSRGGTDALVLDRSRLVFEDLVEYVYTVLESILNENVEVLPDRLSPLLTLLTHILTLHPPEDYTSRASTKLLRLLRCCARIGLTASLLSAATAAKKHCDDSLADFCEVIRLDKCASEAVLCESCVLLLHADEAYVGIDNILHAMEILFTRKDVEPKILSKALERFESLLNRRQDIYAERVNYIIHLVDKLRSVKDASDKEARILHRDVIIFLGKHGHRSNITDLCKENLAVANLRDKLTLDILNTEEGTTYKVNMQQILQSAVNHEDGEVLQKLLAIICVNLSSKQDPSVSACVPPVAASLARSYTQRCDVCVTSLSHAVLLCREGGCVCTLLQYIGEERSPGARKMMSDALEGALMMEPGSEATDLFLRLVSDEAALMMRSLQPTKRSGGLSVTDTLLLALKDNHSLQKELLPDLLTLILETGDMDAKHTFQTASQILVDSREIYEEGIIKKTVRKLTMNVVKSAAFKSELDMKLFKDKVKETVCLLVDIKSLIDVDYLDKMPENFSRVLYYVSDFRVNLDTRFGDVLMKIDEMIIGDDVEGVFFAEAVLLFFETYADQLLEMRRKITIDALNRFLSKLSPKAILKLQKQIQTCLSSYENYIEPAVFEENFSVWLHKLSSVTVDNLRVDDVDTLRSLNLIVDIFKVTTSKVDVLGLCNLVLEIFVDNGLRFVKDSKEYLDELLKIALKFLNLEDVEAFLLKSKGKVGVEFLRCFICIFSDYLLKEPYMLLKEEFEDFSVVIIDLLRTVLKRLYDEEFYITVLKFIEAIWPCLEERCTFAQKHTVLHLVLRFPIRLGQESNPIKWVIREIASCRVEEKIRLAAVLPGGDGCGASYRCLASELPVRLSEMAGVQHSALQALLDALADSADGTTLHIVINLADCDPAKGWWDDAMASSVASLARRGDFTIKTLRFGAGENARVVERQVSLERYSGTTFCEKFYSWSMGKLLSSLRSWPRVPRDDSMVSALMDHTRSFALLALAFEQIPVSSLKNENSQLYASSDKKEPSLLIKEACRLCVNIRSKEIALGNASVELKVAYRECSAENFKCLCAAICVSRPAEKFYKLVFNTKVWEALVDPETEFKLPILSHWSQRRTFHTTAVDVTSGSKDHGSVRTRVFLRTLSEDPLQYDLLQEPEQEGSSQELELSATPLNLQPVATTLTALVKHATALPHQGWRDALAETLVGGSHTNLKWTVAQVICNCKEELTPHASVLRPALLEMVSSTACERNGKRALNGLHMEVLETILLWHESPLPESSQLHLTATIEYLINTAVDNGHRSVFNSLLAALRKVVEIYGQKELPWTGYKEYLNAPDKLKHVYRIALCLVKGKVRIPDLLPTLVKLEDCYWSQDANLPELIGYALACESERAVPLALFRQRLARRRQTDVGDYVKLAYYTQQGYHPIVDEANFRVITDLAPKLVGTNKLRCLNMLATYLENAPESTDRITTMFDTVDISSLIQEHSLEALRMVKYGCRMMSDRLRRSVMSHVAGFCESGDPKLRKAALEVALRVFEDLFGPKHSEPSSKKARLSTSAILSGMESPDVSRVIECVALGVTDPDATISGTVTDSVARCLSNSDFGIRLAECFLICVSIPSTRKNLDVSPCSTAFLELLFRGLMSHLRFQELKLRDEPLEARNVYHSSVSRTVPSRLLTRSRTYHGTFLSSGRKFNRKLKDLSTDGVNVQVPITDILGTLINFTKNKPLAAQSMCIQVIKAVLERSGRGFDARSELARQVCDVLSAMPSDVTPLALEVGRLVADRVKDVPGYSNCLEKLRKLTRHTEGEMALDLLYAEVLLRSEQYPFVMGLTNCEDYRMDVDELVSLSLDDITAAFGTLANWEQLTVQQRSEVQAAGLPQLWVEEDTFKSWLDQYEVQNTKSWFDKLVVWCRDESKQDGLRWLKETDRWPRRHFHVSVVAEMIQRSAECVDDDSLCWDIRAGDCLAEWAVRLMMRRLYPSVDHDSCDAASAPRHHELEWCRRANQLSLPQLAINCIDVNASQVEPSEQLLWMLEKARAFRTVAIETKNEDMLEQAHNILESCQFDALNTEDDVIMMNELKISLYRDLSSLTKDKIHRALQTIEQKTKRPIDSKANKIRLYSLYELAMIHFDNMWDKEGSTGSDVISNMADVLSRVIDLGCGARAEMFLCVILNRLEDMDRLDEETSRSLLDKIDLLIDSLDPFTLDSIRTRVDVFPRELISQHGAVEGAVSERQSDLSRRQQLSLVCDPRHSLLLRCSELRRTGDAKQWKSIFGLMKERIFENPFAAEATEYSLLAKYKDDLYGIEDFETTGSARRQTTLDRILGDLASRTTERKTLRLSQLCPALTRLDATGSEGDKCMSRLLRLGKLSVVKFYEQVSVFTNAVTRPVVLKALLSDGTTKQFIAKTGEQLKLAAAVLKAGSSAAKIWGSGDFCGYTVTPLSGDSGLIEYLEDTVTFRDLITSVMERNWSEQLETRLRSVIVSSSPIEKYKTYCAEIPAYTLRSAMEKRCSSTEDFVRKKMRFTETLSSLTLVDSIFGVGDRHLENLVYGLRDGSAVGVDWGAALQYGRGEPVPARLTRNVLAMADTNALECRLQRQLSRLRESHHLFLAAVKVAFDWMRDDFRDKLDYIAMFLRGERTTYDITSASLTCAGVAKYRDVLRILEQLFGVHKKGHYSVVGQINCLLRQCTEPAVLAHTRDGWEPWI